MSESEAAVVVTSGVKVEKAAAAAAAASAIATSGATDSAVSALRFIDIGANMTDSMFNGMYRGKSKHNGDLRDVLRRAALHGVERIIITGTSLEESRAALDLARHWNSESVIDHCAGIDAAAAADSDTKAAAEVSEMTPSVPVLSLPRLSVTVGCHPTRCDEFAADPDAYERDLRALIAEAGPLAVAVGECGLDYARTQFCAPETQRTYFRRQIDIARDTGLPMFLHLRDAHDDFLDIIRDHSPVAAAAAAAEAAATTTGEEGGGGGGGGISGGVVHSYDGTLDVARELEALGFYIGINGCSLRTVENLETASSLSQERVLLETDAPWCEIRRTHAGAAYLTREWPQKKADKWASGHLVKSRNEPCRIVDVLDVLAAARNQNPVTLAEAAYQNTLRLFFSAESESPSS